MSIAAILENAAMDMKFVCQEIQSAHTEACHESRVLEILLLDLIRDGRELETRLNRVVEAMKEKK